MLALIVESQRSTEIFNEYELNFILSFMKYNINVQDSSIRQQISALVKKALVRIEDSWQLINRSITNPARKTTNNAAKNSLEQLINKVITALGSSGDTNKKEEVEEALLAGRRYAAFLNMLVVGILFDGLNVGCNHVRRAMCLELLCFVYERKFPRDVLYHDQIGKLQYIVEHDTYEGNKALAVKLLAKVFPKNSTLLVSQGCFFKI